MKKVLIVLFVLLTPMSVFAQLSVGGTALLNFALTPDEAAAGADVIGPSDFTFGADARLKLGLLRAGAMALYTPGEPDIGIPDFLEIYPTAGVGIDILFLTTYAGIGPGLGFILDENSEEVFDFGIVLQLSGGLKLGQLHLLLNYLMDFDLDNLATSSDGYFGASVLWSLW